MLGNDLYQNLAVGDYDPESPRPDSMTGTTGPSSVVPGAGESHGMDFGAPPPPPPPPMMGLPGQFMGRQGISKIPGPGSGGSTGGGVAPPMWPPSKLPTMMGKPPLAAPPMQQQQDVDVSRTSSLQSGSWNTRSSFDAPSGGLGNVGLPAMNSSHVGEPPRFQDQPPESVLPPQEQYSHQEQQYTHDEQQQYVQQYTHDEQQQYVQQYSHDDQQQYVQQYSHEEQQQYVQQYSHEEQQQYVQHQEDENTNTNTNTNTRSTFETHEYHIEQEVAPQAQGSLPGGDASQGTTSNRLSKMPPPAIAKESPLRALYARGTEGYEQHRKKINLNMPLDAVAHTNRVPTMSERDNEMPSVEAASMHSHDPEPPQQANAPPLFPTFNEGLSSGYQEPAAPEPAHFDGNQGLQAFEPPPQFMGGESMMQSNRPSSSQFLEEESYVQSSEPPSSSQFMGGEPHMESTGPPPSQFMGGESTMPPPETEHQDHHTKTRPPTKKKKLFFLFRKRFVLVQLLFFTMLVVNPPWIMRHITVAGAMFQSGLAGYALVEPFKFRGMLHSQFPPQSSVYPYIETIENCFNMFTQASQNAWDGTEPRVACSSSSIMCRWAKSAVHGSLMAGMVSKECTLSFYKAIPGLVNSAVPCAMQLASATKSFMQSGKLWNVQFLKESMVQKGMDARKNAALLIHGAKDFVICAARTSFKSGRVVNLSRNIILCWTSSFEEFLKAHHIESEIQEPIHPEEHHDEEEQHPYMDDEEILNLTETVPHEQGDASMAEYDTMEQYARDDIQPTEPQETLESGKNVPKDTEEYPHHEVNYMDDTLYGKDFDTMPLNDTKEDTHVFHEDSEYADNTTEPHEPEYPTYDGGMLDDEQIPAADELAQDLEGTPPQPPTVPVENPESIDEVPLHDNDVVPEVNEPVPVKENTEAHIDSPASDSGKDERGSDLRAMLESNPHDTIDDTPASKEEKEVSVTQPEQEGETPKPNNAELITQRARAWILDTCHALQDKTTHAALLLVHVVENNKAHIMTAAISALAVSSIFLAQGYLTRNRTEKDMPSAPKSVLGVDTMDTPVTKAADHDDDEPLTVYKSARSTRKRRSKVSNDHPVDEDDEVPVAPRASARRSSRGSTRKQTPADGEQKATRSSSRTRRARSTSSSRKKSSTL